MSERPAQNAGASASDWSISEDADGAMFEVRVTPRARYSRILGVHDGALKVSLTAPPVDGAANLALVALLARALGVPRSQLEIRRGQTARVKRIRVRGMAAQAVRERLR